MKKCHANLIHEAIRKFSHLLYVKNHPIFQNILIQHVRDKILMPSELASIMNKFVLDLRTVTESKYQSGDAILEELNKKGKSWLKMYGVPRNDELLKVFRNIDDFTQVVKHLF